MFKSTHSLIVLGPLLALLMAGNIFAAPDLSQQDTILDELKINLVHNRLAASISKKAFFSIHGGYASCSRNSPEGIDVHRAFVQTVDFLELHDIRFEFVVSCFPKSGNKLYYIDSRDIDYTFKMRVAEFPTWMLGRLEQSEDPISYFVAGHSHGGWLALKIASQLSLDIPLVGILTLDPISRVNCKTPITQDMSPQSAASGFLSSYYQECLRAPTDISLEDYQAIVDRTGWFENYYQTAAPYLHSSPIEGADNVHVKESVRGLFDIFGPHVRIDSNAEAWGAFQMNVLSHFER